MRVRIEKASKFCFALAVAALLTSCGGVPVTVAAPRTQSLTLSLSASGDLNPDAQGRPSPVKVRVYQLRTSADFARVEYNAIFAGTDSLAAAALLPETELRPGETRSVTVEIPADAGAIAVAAAYRDPAARWRATLDLPADTVDVALSATAVSLAAGSR
jgi:type VI secretion system protein VasD